METTRAQIALKAFEEGYNCSQSVFLAFAREAGLEDEAALKVSSAFGAGMGRMQLTCGAVTGALLAIGLAKGNSLADDAARRERTYAMAKEFAACFMTKRKTLSCAEILGCDLNTDAGRESFTALGLRQSTCAGCVTDAVEMLSSLLEIG